jgi:hypothetical protein
MKTLFRIVPAWSAALLLACSGGESPTQVVAPGQDKAMRTSALEAGAAVLQDKAPIDAINTYLDGFHFYSGNMQAQMEAHHYCNLLNEDFIQCVIYDGNGGDAKLMGIEYIVSAKIFETLPEDEKKLWHSHVHEVRSGQLIAPGIPQAAEKQLMKKIEGTYGKTWHTWHTDQAHRVPLGHPMLMMGFTQDGQINESLVAQRDARFDVSTAERRQQRADIDYPAIHPAANAWEKGIVAQLQLTTTESSQTRNAAAPAPAPR